jgi:hypothetical protein
LAAACGGGGGAGGGATPDLSCADLTAPRTPIECTETFIPKPGNSELVVGPNRISIAVSDKKNDPFLGDPGNSVQLQFKDAGGTLIGSAEDATFVQAIAATSGFWVLNHTFEAAGQSPAQITIAKGKIKQAIDITFVVTQTGNAPTIGQAAPATINPTFANQPNKKQITTDSKPNDAFYQMTVTQALDAHKPFVVVFATPKFCQSALCGPVLDNVKAVQPDFADKVNFIHIEPYKLDANGGLVSDANGLPIAIQSTDDWHLKTEPWIFVVDAGGKITARFEGSASPDELRQALQNALG